MIQSWSDKIAEAFFESGALPKGVGWTNCRKVVARKLDMLDAARELKDLLVPPNNRLEALQGDRRGQHSIRVNDQWRVCFVWSTNGPEKVELVDYHK